MVSTSTAKETTGVNNEVVTTVSTSSKNPNQNQSLQPSASATTKPTARRTSNADKINYNRPSHSKGQSTNSNTANKPSSSSRSEPSDVEVAVRGHVLKLLQAHANTDNESAVQVFKELAALINRIRQSDSVTQQQVSACLVSIFSFLTC